MKIIATDLEFFRLIATAGCCNLEQARKIYEPVSNNIITIEDKVLINNS